MSKRYTENFNTVQLQSYSDAQIAFIATVEHDYRAEGLAALVADYAEELDKLAKPMKYIIQPKGGDVSEPRPFPYSIDADGKVLDQDFWKGDPAGLIGFQKDLDVQRVGLFFRDFTENPMAAIGMYPVFVEETGGLYCFTKPVESVQVLP